VSRRGLIYRLALIAALLAGSLFLALHRDLLQSRGLARELARLGHWAPILFVLLYALATVLFVPGSAFSLAGGAIFGPVWGTVWNLVGATSGAGLAFIAARYLASGWVAKKSGERLNRVLRGVEAEGWRFVAFVRLVPLFPFNLLNYALGLTRIEFGVYILTSAICMVPGAFAYTWLGYTGRQAVAGSENRVSDLLIAIGVFAALALLPRLVRRLREQARFVEASKLWDDLGRTLETVVIDVRSREEFSGRLGHIRGAHNIPIGELSAALLRMAEMKTRPIVLVCKTDNRAARGARLLLHDGFERVLVLRGGMENWLRSGFPVVRDAAERGRDALL
jgi:uncharacterized membrane protein YdjX (TVP38/TMEM64 family)/rhodanese-related sulfurtransferase